ncbi:H(+)-transporting V0 sector ATPase subunit a NDAI_0E00940 [Naumovozyma dairenensis CBS 421]|uniref:V-type proton ATPase subunit a n=1 Tax=Naumovozyma dairenensis (strain ATCC 10597 / BCRC 20456 / CBS 421 / NBRC 0211 / NRRL Y-12639) TaxID=1071378 RepID=G0WAZ0_NAUDC|nr:hypothetical protein NDAI_0E00940 [Naumovozyma dairenensis CBS 421]CCD24910.1 hypothetical protein NDAI_0E00940 [Naumovozyma dairenensis CBS 421]
MSAVETVPKDEAMFRSAVMSLVQLYIPQEIARDAVYTLGQLGIVQFRDLNSETNSFQRTFVDEIRRLDNVQRQYRYFFKLLQKHNIPLYEGAIEQYDRPSNLNDANIMSQLIVPPSTSAIDDHVQNAALLEQRLVQMEEATEQIEAQKVDLEQYRIVLQSGDQFFQSGDSMALAATATVVDLEDTLRRSSITINFVTGIIPRDKINTFEQILWRVLRGNLFFKHIEIEQPIFDVKTQSYIAKNAFIVYSHGDLILDRIKRIAESLDAHLYEIDKNPESRSQKLLKINENLSDLYTVLQSTTTTLESELFGIGQELNSWYQDIAREKSTYETLNKFNFDKNRKTLIAEGWIPEDELSFLKDCLVQMTSKLGVDVPSIIQVLGTNKTPPTFHRLNKFTQAFQSICDSYGVPQYREVNPGLPTIVTFPFMFAIMFGDMGHGFIMTMAALVFVLNEKKFDRMKRGEILDMAYTGRYIILFMGLFSMYTGFLYNDIFSRSMTLFKSGWEWPEDFKAGEMLYAKKVGTYPIGIDWAWHGAENSLLFSNSYKMKLSIVMGFIHMTYSYMFSLVNHLHFKSMIDIVANFIPGLLFMQGIFGYLSVCIIYKWSVDWIGDGKAAPGLLNMIINMFLAPGTIDEELYPHQAKVQIFLLGMALLCVPWLLLMKPLHFKFTHSEKKNSFPTADDIETQALLHDENEDEIAETEGTIAANNDSEEGEGHGEELGDVIIHQVIHTIEFCLNCVSHTASYLRLWALSLAHAQLSSVLWSMTLELSFGVPGALGVFMTVSLFTLWFCLTIAVLVMMEGTSAMLHSLRLHWVESMSKYFVGDGIPYEPFVFQYLDMETDVANNAGNIAA